ncbi:hypothetical protein [Aquisediminimonas sediminicola]|uniref:hypothetical protein n=1 Tax=Alteraquisediminimonas sediminicola TaxID=2676787 RepID=UPI001C8D5E14|nr:hypothetical protein [Aquisediminimonas sediminicola]
MVYYLVLFAIVLGINLMPAFGPPTWSVIVIYGINTRMPGPALVLVAASAAASGRFLLARAFALLGHHVSEKTKRNVAAAREVFERKKRNSIIALGVFALSPVPSAPLFEAAGLAKVPLLGFTAFFFAGRTFSYSIYLFTTKSIESTNLGEAFRHAMTSPFGIALQIAMVLMLIGFTRIDWSKYLNNRS